MQGHGDGEASAMWRESEGRKGGWTGRGRRAGAGRGRRGRQAPPVRPEGLAALGTGRAVRLGKPGGLRGEEGRGDTPGGRHLVGVPGDPSPAKSHLGSESGGGQGSVCMQTALLQPVQPPRLVPNSA